MATEKRLIDANALLQKLSRMIEYCKTDSKVNGLTALFQVGDAVMDCPTVDAVEVVRCKDCKYNRRIGMTANSLCDHPLGMWGIYEPTFFCSYGERRNDNA